MELQALIDQTDLDMTVAQVRAFFLGVLTATKPLPFPKALTELLAPSPDAKSSLEPDLKKMWDQLSKNHPAELQNLFTENANIVQYLTDARDQLDYFLTALSISGTNADTDNEDLADMIDELEDVVMDMDEFVTQKNPNLNEGKEIKETLLETWADFVQTHKD